VFVRSGVNWQQQQRIVPFDGSTWDLFGQSVALEGDFAVVGAPVGGLGAGSGQAWSFARSGATWSEEHRFQPGSADTWEFGSSVAIWPTTAGPHVFIGAAGGTDPNGLDPVTNWDTGSVSVYSRVVTSWFRRAWFHSESAHNGAEFGASLAISEGTLVVGAPGTNRLLSGVDAGAVYVFEGSTANPGTWPEQPRLVSPVVVANGRFGAAVALDGGLLVVGAPGETGAVLTSGAAHVYDGRTSSFTYGVKLQASSGAASDRYGTSVAIDGMTVIVGAPGEDGLGAGAGQAHIH